MQYDLISIGTVFLTSDGTDTGRKCRTVVTGIEALLAGFRGATQTAIDGTPYLQVTANNYKGIRFSINVNVTPDTELQALMTQINTALSGGNAIQVTIDGSRGTYDLQCLPDLTPGAVTGGEETDIGGRIKNLIFNFIIAGVTP